MAEFFFVYREPLQSLAGFLVWVGAVAFLHRYYSKEFTIRPSPPKPEKK